MNRIVKYGLVILKDKKFLINRKKNTKLFLMPGGKPEEGETIDTCLEREIKEELNCALDRDSIKLLGKFEDYAANEPDTIIEIHLYLGEIKGTPTANMEIEELRWFSKNDNPNILSPIIKNKILPELIKKNLI